MTEKDQQEKKLQLIKGLFKAREDVFALHWRKGNKRGYMPACQFDPYMYRRHKMKGGTFGNYKDKTHLPLTDQQILKHLNGEQLIGIYPLLTNDHSWFIAADFDKENWLAECKGFIKICNENGIPAYLLNATNWFSVWLNSVLFITSTTKIVRHFFPCPEGLRTPSEMKKVTKKIKGCEDLAKIQLSTITQK